MRTPTLTAAAALSLGALIAGCGSAPSATHTATAAHTATKPASAPPATALYGRVAVPPVRAQPTKRPHAPAVVSRHRASAPPARTTAQPTTGTSAPPAAAPPATHTTPTTTTHAAAPTPAPPVRVRHAHSPTPHANAPAPHAPQHHANPPAPSGIPQGGGGDGDGDNFGGPSDGDGNV